MMEKKKSRAIVFDIDNTILYHTNRNPYNWSDLSGDTPIPGMVVTYQSLVDFTKDTWPFLNVDFIFLTGRPESARETTSMWLLEHGFNHEKLIMKEGSQYQKSEVTKKASMEKLMEEYNVLMVFEDKPECVEVFKEMGLLVLQPHFHRQSVGR